MIVVTRLNDSQFAVNPDLIERIHANPDTTLVMVDGASTSSPRRCRSYRDDRQYRAHVVAMARDSHVPPPWVPSLGLVLPARS